MSAINLTGSIESILFASRTAGAIALKLSHGYSVEPTGTDPLVHLVESAAKEFYIATVPGRWLVDSLPFCKPSSYVLRRQNSASRLVRYLPDWLPGTGFKRVAKRFRKTNMEQAIRPHEFVEKQLVGVTKSLRV